MPLKLTEEALRSIYGSRAKPEYIQAFIAKQGTLELHGVSETRTRLAIFLAQLGHESGGLRITEENMNYSAERMAVVWPRRFDTRKYPNEAVDPAPFAHNPKALAIKTYGSQMGNRPGTDDGWVYRGSGPIQITGSDGYENVGRIAKLPLKQSPDMARNPAFAPEIAAAFWTWKNLNSTCDVGDFVGNTKKINGGTIGIEDRRAWLAKVKPIVDALEGGPSTKEPPKEVVAEATKKERAAVAAGAGGAGAGGASEATKTGTTQPDKPADGFLSPVVTWTLIGVGLAVLVLAGFLYARKKQLLKDHWF